MSFHGAGLSVAPKICPSEIAVARKMSEEVSRFIYFKSFEKNNVYWMLHGTASNQCRVHI